MSITQSQAQELAQYYSHMTGETLFSTVGIEGKEGDRTTYVSKVSFADLATHFNLVPTNNAPAGVMLQRELATSRKKGIANYIKNNCDFVFPELIAVVGDLDVKATSISSIVNINLSKTSFRYLVDGQGRLYGIKDALDNDPSLADQTVDVKFIISRGVAADAQIFTDINKTPTSPNASQCIAMDTRQVLSKFAKEAVLSNPSLTQRVDFSKASVTGKTDSETIWTLNQFSKFIQILTGTTARSAEKMFDDEAQRTHWIGFINKFMTELQRNPFFADAINHGSGASTKDSIVATSVFLKSLALFGKVILMNFAVSDNKEADWSFMDTFANIDLSTSNKEWVGRCLNYRGRFEDKSFNHQAVASFLSNATGLEVPEELETVEEEVLMARASILKLQREEAKAKASNQNDELDLAS